MFWNKINSALTEKGLAAVPLHRLIWALLGFGACTLAAYSMLLTPKLTGHGPIFIKMSRDIVNGAPLKWDDAPYQAYSWAILPLVHYDAHLWFYTLFNFALTLCTGIFLFISARYLFGTLAAIISTALFFLIPDIQVWNFYLLNEMWTMWLTIGLLTCAFYSGRSWLAVIGLIAFAFVTIHSRPDAIYFLVPTALYLILANRNQKKILVFIALALLMAVQIGGGAGNTVYDIFQHWSNGTYIWDYKGIGKIPQIASNPKGLSFVEFLAQLWQVFWAHPLFCLELVLTRIAYFFGHVRPFYSLPHNVMIVAGLLVIYGGALVGTVKVKNYWPEKLLILAVLGLQALMVGLTWADWDGRFLTRLLPMVLWLTGAGLAALISSFLPGEKAT